VSGGKKLKISESFSRMKLGKVSKNRKTPPQNTPEIKEA
jgi:hypothetical protein